MNTDNVNFCTRSRLHQREAYRTSGLGRFFCRLFYYSASTPRMNDQFFSFFWFGIHTASVPSTARTSTGGGTVLGNPEQSPARRPSLYFFYNWLKSEFIRGLSSLAYVQLRWGWVFLERTRILSGIQFTMYFIEIFVVETKR